MAMRRFTPDRFPPSILERAEALLCPDGNSEARFTRAQVDRALTVACFEYTGQPVSTARETIRAWQREARRAGKCASEARNLAFEWEARLGVEGDGAPTAQLTRDWKRRLAELLERIDLGEPDSQEAALKARLNADLANAWAKAKSAQREFESPDCWDGGFAAASALWLLALELKRSELEARAAAEAWPTRRGRPLSRTRLLCELAASADLTVKTLVVVAKEQTTLASTALGVPLRSNAAFEKLRKTLQKQFERLNA